MTKFKRALVRFEGSFACFTPPHLRPEPYSYPVITPSAAVGLLEALHWKPAFEYQVTRIFVERPLGQTQRWTGHVLAQSTGMERALRTHTVLRDVSYVIEADIVPRHETPGTHAYYCTWRKHYDTLKRGAESGRAFRTPYLGMSDFAVSSFEWLNSENDANPIATTLYLGPMVRKIYFKKTGHGKNRTAEVERVLFYDVYMKNGVIEVNSYVE